MRFIPRTAAMTAVALAITLAAAFTGTTAASASPSHYAASAVGQASLSANTAAPTSMASNSTNLVAIPMNVNSAGGSLSQRNSNFAASFWGRVGNYFTCILGVGVPIGAAIVIAALPTSWAFLYRWAAGQAAAGDRGIISYIYRVKNGCAKFITS